MVGQLKRSWKQFATRRLSCLAAWVPLIMLACAVPISYYDVTTYKNLTELKVDATRLVASFDTKNPSENKAAVEDVVVRLQKIYEYEKGKGHANALTVEQLEKIQRLFNEKAMEYMEEGPGKLGKKYFSESATVLGQAFDIAIETESSKNKDKQ